MWCLNRQCWGNVTTQSSTKRVALRGRKGHLHLQQNLSLSLILCQAVRDKRSEHVTLDLPVGTKARGGVLLCDAIPGSQYKSTFATCYIHQETKTYAINLAKPVISFPVGSKIVNTREAKMSYTHGYIVTDKNMANVLSVVARYPKRSSSRETNSKGSPYAKSAITSRVKYYAFWSKSNALLYAMYQSSIIRTRGLWGRRRLRRCGGRGFCPCIRVPFGRGGEHGLRPG